ncbi:TrbG/VirB9 family P-type conjugative transfer protein [Caulobacter sp. SL161]|uniref:TrbG/VirB9 family P-type conjugative transfer protein n=1 Tax=Caulobacter sp. SL161 TaxID=2995156 RepID=UPI002274BCF5|nr:TrbG/VirB9 family P-type conjugative transfer protein [Caulobacter sp. SL161]MCY1647469.1 TrbG/VirB9 family P-type conjugative transfer protein [Caulobacter sp. SL161]
MMKATLFAAASLAAATPAHADPRIRELAYDPKVVVALSGCPGFQSTIAFAEGERIENIAMGDSNLWQVTPNKRSDLLFLKPTQPAAHTNMMVVTDRRRYSFELSVRGAAACKAGQVVYDLRFTYPNEPKPQAIAETAPLAPPAPAEDAPPPPAARNAAYTFTGASANVPVRVFDDGKSTWLKWADGVAAPAIYTLGPDKSEAMVNYSVKGDYIVVDAVAPALVLRRGASVATLYNDAYQTPQLDEAAPQPRAAAEVKPAKTGRLARLITPTQEIAQ